MKTSAGLYTEETGPFFDMAEEDLEACNRIITEFLEMAQGKEPRKQEVPLAALVQEAVQRSKVPETLPLQYRSEPDPFMVWGDPMQLEQVLSNLFANATQAMKGTGRLTVTARKGEAGQDEILVADTGAGIAAEHRDQIFEPLFSTKTTGVGFGLTLCRQVIERHGGTIELVATEQPGTTFCLRLPQAPSPVQG